MNRLNGSRPSRTISNFDFVLFEYDSLTWHLYGAKDDDSDQLEWHLLFRFMRKYKDNVIDPGTKVWNSNDYALTVLIDGPINFIYYRWTGSWPKTHQMHSIQLDSVHFEQNSHCCFYRLLHNIPVRLWQLKIKIVNKCSWIQWSVFLVLSCLVHLWVQCSIHKNDTIRWSPLENALKQWNGLNEFSPRYGLYLFV